MESCRLSNSSLSGGQRAFQPYGCDLLGLCTEAGVKGLVHFGMGLTLREGNREYFFAALDRHFPGMKQRYLERYGLSYELPSPNNAALCRIIRETCESQRMLEGADACFSYLREFPEPYEQTSLF